jgi:acyl-homoserine-lactone acylase
VQVRDWVVASGETNAVLNDSVVLEGWSPLVVAPGRPLGPVERRSLLSVGELVEAVPTDPLTADTIAAGLLDHRGLVSELLLDEVVERCTDPDSVVVPGRQRPDGSQLWLAQRVDVGEVCRLLERWSGEWNLDDQAPLVWAQFLAGFSSGDLRGAGPLFAEDFDPADPIGTPSGLSPVSPGGFDPVMVALAEAALTVEAAGLRVDDAWLNGQWVQRGGEQIPLHGDTGTDGNVNRMWWVPPGPAAEPQELGRVVDARTGLREGGRAVNAGTSAVMVVRFASDGVSATALLAPGQSSDPASPFHVDQAYRFSDRAWRTVLFDSDDVASAAERSEELIASRLAGPLPAQPVGPATTVAALEGQ